MNPYKRIEGLYADDKLQLYANKDIGEEDPHVYAIANECYTCMWKREESQCVLIRSVYHQGSNLSNYCTESGCIAVMHGTVCEQTR